MNTPLNTYLTHLEITGLIRLVENHPDLAYFFRHALVQDAAYASLLKSDRKQLHQLVAETLESLFAEQLDTVTAQLGQHFALAGNNVKAIPYLLQAGDQARLRFAHHEAILFYEQALDLITEKEDFEQAARVWLKLGLTYHNIFDFTKAQSAYEKGFSFWQQASNTNSQAASQPAPHPLRVTWSEPRTLDPTRTIEAFSLAWVNQMFGGLVKLNAELDIEPDIAVSWQLLDEGRRYIFHLREDVYWSDGQPVTAFDFAFTWQRLLQVGTGKDFLSTIKGVNPYQQTETAVSQPIPGIQAINDTTLQIELKQPTGHFLQLLTLCRTHAIPRHAVQKHGEAWATPENLITNGPFKLASWQKGKSITLTQNPHYSRPRRGNAQTIQATFGDTHEAQLARYENNQLDMIDIWGYPTPLKNQIRDQHAGDLITWPKLQIRYLVIHPNHAPFNDVRVRQALALAIDRDKLAHIIHQGHEVPAKGGFLPLGMPGHLPQNSLSFDPVRAKTLLAEAGYANGQGFPQIEGAINSASHVTQSESEFLRQNWRKFLNIDVVWHDLQQSDLNERARTESISLYINVITASFADPADFLPEEYYPPFGYWTNSRYRALVEAAQRATDQQQRLALYQQADAVLVEEAAMIPLGYGQGQMLLKPWIKLYPTSPVKWWQWQDVVIEPHREG